MGRETGTIDALGDRTTMTYLANGLSGQSQDANGNTTTPVYDSFNRGIEAGQINAVNSVIRTHTQASLDNLGRVTASQDADGFWSLAAYDSVGETTQTTDA